MGDDVKLSRAEMQKAKDQEFFDIYLKNGGNAKAAAAEMGLSNAAVSGHQYKQRVLANITKHTHKALTQAVPTALATLMSLVKESKNDRVKLDAAKTVLEFSGFKPPEKSIVITKNMSAEELDAELRKYIDAEVADAN